MAESEFEPLLRALEGQTCQDFEFVGEVGGTIPQAWNRALERARGEILVFTETDALPVDECWLAELVGSIPDQRTAVKGLEVTSSPLDLSNLAAHREVFVGQRFDEQFRWAEDTELFCRMKEQGIRFVQVDRAPVIHIHKYASRRYIRRAFWYGLYWARLKHRFADPVDVMGLSWAIKLLLSSLLNISGLLIGWIIYLPQRRFRNTGK